MQCPKCGKEILNPNSMFCRNCGAKLINDDFQEIKEPEQKPQNNNSVNPQPKPQPYESVNTGQPSNLQPADNNNKKKMPVWAVALIPVALLAIIFIMTLATGVVEIEFTDDNNNIADSNSGDFNINTDITEVVETTTETTTREHTYEVLFNDCTWAQAASDCISRGGHLVTIDSEEEFSKITSMLSAYSLKNIYFIGACRDLDTYDYYWNDQSGKYGYSINSNSHWLTGEPSFIDNDTGTIEDCVSLLYTTRVNNWVYNDIPNDYLSAAEYKRGQIAYICEYE